MKTVMIYYGGFLKRTGGAFSHARIMGNELHNLGWKVEIITLDNLPLWCRYMPHVVERLVNSVYAPLGFLYKAYLTKILFRSFYDKKSEMRIFEDIYLSWNSNIPSVSILHAVWSDNLQAFSVAEERHKIFRESEAVIINKITHPVVTVSFPYRDFIVNEHFSGSLSKAINVIELGIDQKKFHDLKQANRTRKSIIYSGTLEARKNIFFLLDVFKKLYERDCGYSLTIVGDGPDREKLLDFVNVNHLPVRFLGRVDHDKVLSELFCHEIYIHASVKESFSFSLLEAKLAGLKTCAYAKLQIPSEFIDVGFDTFSVEEWCCGIMNITTGVNKFDGSKYTAERMALSTLNLINC